TTVRVPVLNSHSESINVELARPYDLAIVKQQMSALEGLVVQDDPAHNIYPMASTSAGKNDVFVGRMRRDDSVENGLNLWVVADNIRKGAATNTVQIAKYMIEHEMV
ncbi:MAG: Asd/ArgC dimerization domain-containing protein, partial [Pygmaiobacter sp.]